MSELTNKKLIIIMNRKTYVTKINTIIENSESNTSLNPICELIYGNGFSRVLLYIDTTKITNLINDNIISDVNKLTHILKLKNTWGTQKDDVNTLITNFGNKNIKERTSSFDLYLYRLNESWDGGIGTDNSNDGFLTNTYNISTNGSNWFNSKTDTTWETGNGVLTDTMRTLNLVTSQHFEFGNEDIEMDITNEINDILNDMTPNNGFILTFSQNLEELSTENIQYTGFYTNNTHTPFKPYIETIYNSFVKDDRYDFYLNKNNKLYFYSIINGEYTDLDSPPSCTINDEIYTVQQQSKGIYYITVNLDSSYNENTIYNDVWDSIQYNGILLNAVEQEFVVKPSSEYYQFNTQTNNIKYIPYLSSLKNKQKISNEDTLNVYITFKEEYSQHKTDFKGECKYRIYTEIDEIDSFNFIDYTQIEQNLNGNYFTIYGEDYQPGVYFIDIKLNTNNNEFNYKKIGTFEIT